MKEYEERTETIEQQKALIRERYKGINPDVQSFHANNDTYFN